MQEKWIGEENNTSGSYYETTFPQLKKRRGGYYDAIELYKFDCRYGNSYYITDDNVIIRIKELLQTNDEKAIHEYLMSVVIERFGVYDFIIAIEVKLHQEFERGYKNGTVDARQTIRKALGL